MGKDKKEKKAKKRKAEDEEPQVEAADGAEKSYDDLLARVCVIAKPMASEKLTKKLYKAVKKAHTGKTLCRGVKEVGKALRKGEKG